MLLPLVLALAASCLALSVPRATSRQVDDQAPAIPHIADLVVRKPFDEDPCPSPFPSAPKIHELTVVHRHRKVNVTDAATNDDTQCNVEYGPCAWSGERPPEVPKPDAPKPATCQNEEFKFWFSKFDSMRNFSVEISHTYHDKDTGSDVVHTGDSGWINYDLTWERGYSFRLWG
ncbi:hypothetical protein PG997_003767 [Apiospora hydei]|uniref:AA1-like domain-containing protein n=1 Tax=Apiospora hydei TaxID=1337664 RepID=A0ABR1X056_9PEZI